MRKDYLIESACEDFAFRSRFWSKVRKTDTCWLWTGVPSSTGYGGIAIPKHLTNGGRYVIATAHRVAWIMARGVPAVELCVLHNCPEGDNRLCVNLDHLWLGTQGDNMRDMFDKNRERIICGDKHYMARFSDDDIRHIRSSNARNAFLAAQYGVNKNTISAIRLRRSWKHVT